MTKITITAPPFFLGALALIFVVAKLWHVVNWSWWLVLLPVLLPIYIVVSVALLLLLGMGILKGCLLLCDLISYLWSK